MNLKDFRPDHPNFDNAKEALKIKGREIPTSTYHEEINTLKIDKLSNRVTIISIIIPCLIGAVFIFAYLDITERVVDVDQTKQSQVERVSQQVEEKLNGLDVKIAKNRYDLDNQLPVLNKKTLALEGQMVKLAGSKADTNAINDQFNKLKKRVVNNANQDKTTLQTFERINKETLSTIKKNQTLFDTTALQIKNEITLFKEEFDIRLLELSHYDEQIGELRKNLSLLEKKYKHLEQETISSATLDERLTPLKTDLNHHIKTMDQQVDTLNRKLTANISRLQKDLDLLMNLSSPKTSTQKTPPLFKPTPQINIDSSDSVKIEQESLVQ
jgi:chromosome segregation ATPase